jgi:hypothetical protein
MDIVRKMYTLQDKPLRGKQAPLILLGILTLSVIIIVAAIVSPMAKATELKSSVVNNGPLDIRLIGVCPDGGEQMYDASGRKLKATMGLLGAFHTYWEDEDQCRDFVFEVPNVNDQLLFLPHAGICLAGTNRRLGGSHRSYLDPTDNPSTFIYSATFDRFYRKQVAYLFHTKAEIRHIDFTLRYFYGPCRQAICTFTGPFVIGQTVHADSNSPYSLTPSQSKGFPQNSGIDLIFTTSKPFDYNTVVVAYDHQGRRYLLGSNGGRSGRWGANITYRDIPLPLNEIDVITFREEPYEITFKNIAVDYPDQPHRTYPEFYDEMSKRLGLNNKSPKVLANYDFKNPAEAIKVINIFRGEQQIRKTFEAIRYGKPKVDITKLDQATQDKIRRAAKTWAEIDILVVYGIQLGLMGKWPEFFDMAIERLGWEEATYGNGYPYYERTWRQDNANIANTMVSYRMDRLTVEQVQKIKQLILKTDNGSVLRYLFLYLEWTKSQAITDTLWELAQNEKPWIWWQATEAWYSRESRIRNVYDGLPEKMKLRVILVERDVRDENLNAKTFALLTEIFTPELGKMASPVWNNVREKIAREFDKKAAADIFVNYLRQLQSEMTFHQWVNNNSFQGDSKWMAAYIIRTLNVWYDTNIANLGTDETIDSSRQEPRSFYEFQNLITQALQWYDGDKDKTPVELPFAGKVVDTSGIPVVGAELRLTKIENYEDEYGHQAQHRVSLGQCRTDTEGRFSFDFVENGEHYLFDITAEGFVPKQMLDIQRLEDGRYRYREEAAPEDNVVVLQRPGKISGIVIGADGKPLANAKLTLSTVNRYSDLDMRRTIRTDSEGKFKAEGISKGHFLLSYADIRMVPNGLGSHQEYGGLCGAFRLETEEAGHLTGVVLDLSKSDCSLELQVVDDANEPVRNISFTLDVVMDGGNYKYAPFFSVREVSQDGVYRFGGMPPGAWSLRICKNHKYSMPKRINVDLTHGKTARYKVIFE